MSYGLKQRIRVIQQHLSVEADGLIGPNTLSAIEDHLGIEEEENYYLCVPTIVIDQIRRWEISSQSYYEDHLTHPYWPGGASGITIGIGYDLGYHEPGQIVADWNGSSLTGREISRLCMASMARGVAAKELLERHSKLREVTIDYEDAHSVFLLLSLPTYAAMAARAFPGVDNYSPFVQGAVLSLVYNRGTSMRGKSRAGMRELADAIAKGEKPEVLSRIVYEMSYRHHPSSGLAARRKAEAHMMKKTEETPTRNV